MKQFIRCIDWLSGFCGAAAGLALVAGLALTLAEILARGMLSKTLFITDEYSGYLMCGMTFLGLAYTLREKGHIRMTFLHKALSPESRKKLDLLCYAIGLLFCGVIVKYTWAQFWSSLVLESKSMQVSETYLAVPQFFVPLGAAILALQFLAELLKTIQVLKGDTDGLLIREEIEDLGR
jgi:TRAP-type C4-dicarboxylate transport system permease small subunit